MYVLQQAKASPLTDKCSSFDVAFRFFLFPLSFFYFSPSMPFLQMQLRKNHPRNVALVFGEGVEKRTAHETTAGHWLGFSLYVIADCNNHLCFWQNQRRKQTVTQAWGKLNTSFHSFPQSGSYCSYLLLSLFSALPVVWAFTIILCVVGEFLPVVRCGESLGAVHASQRAPSLIPERWLSLTF